MCIFTVFLNKTYEFVSFVQDKMKQTELGEVIGRRCQDQSEEGEAGGRMPYKGSQVHSSSWWSLTALHVCVLERFEGSG